MILRCNQETLPLQSSETDSNQLILSHFVITAHDDLMVNRRRADGCHTDRKGGRRQ